MYLWSEAYVQDTTIGLSRLHATLLATGQIAIDGFLKVVPQFVYIVALVGYTVFCQSLYLTKEAIVLLAVFHTSCVALVFKFSHICPFGPNPHFSRHAYT